jgi:hypothetical protein
MPTALLHIDLLPNAGTLNSRQPVFVILTITS